MPTWYCDETSSRTDKILSAINFTLLSLAVFLALIAAIVLFTKSKPELICDDPACVRAANHILNFIDPDADPCEDFYRFACGKYHKDRNSSWYIDNNVYDKIPLKIKTELRKIVTDPRFDETNCTRSVKEIRKFYTACAEIEQLEYSDKKFFGIISEIVGGFPLGNNFNGEVLWPLLMERARSYGLRHDFFFDVTTAYHSKTYRNKIRLTPPNITQVQKEIWDEKNLDMLISLVKLWEEGTYESIRESVQFAEDTDYAYAVQQAIRFAKNLFRIIEDGSKWHQNIELKQINTMSGPGIFFPIIWLNFLRSMTNLPCLKHREDVLWELNDNQYFVELRTVMMLSDPRYWSTYIGLNMILQECDYLSGTLRDTCSILHSRYNHPSREEFCFNEAVIYSNNAILAHYIRTFVTEDKRTALRNMFEELKQSLKAAIYKLTHITSDDKDKAVKYLSYFQSEIGWTELIYNATTFEEIYGYISVDLESLRAGDMRRELRRFWYDYLFNQTTLQPVEVRSDRLNSPIADVKTLLVLDTGSIMYGPQLLYSPNFELERPKYLNYATIGTILVHPLMHVFNPRRTWKRDLPDFRLDEDQCVRYHYADYMDSWNLIDFEGGFISTNEDLADIVGVDLAYRAYKEQIKSNNTIEYRLPGLHYTPAQIFWIMSSLFYCRDLSIEDVEDFDSTIDYVRIGHNPNTISTVPSYRVNVPKFNSEKFFEDFKCSETSKMYQHRARCSDFAEYTKYN